MSRRGIGSVGVGVSTGSKGSRTAAAARVERLEERRLFAGEPLVINEFLALNVNGITDSFGERSDWIEVHNPTSSSVNLQGWRLTDDPLVPAKWTFPSRSIPAGGYLLVFANDRNLTPTSGELATNFKLTGTGEYLGLIRPDGTIAHEYEPTFPAQADDVSYGLLSGSEQFFTSPTPGAANRGGTQGIVADTKFSVDRGYFDSAFDLAITTATPGATIRYTTDGRAPTSSSGTVYSGPIRISDTTTVRAAAFKSGFLSTAVDSQTYIFPGDVIRQDSGDAPSHSNWGHDGPDWAMDQNIVNNSRWSGTIRNDLKDIPSLSISMPWSNWFGSGGIYISGSGVEKPAAIEMIRNDGLPEFELTGSVEIQGGTSDQRWKMDKLSMQIKFKEPYGPTKLESDVFAGAAFGETATTKFDTLILDATLGYSFSHPEEVQSDRAVYIQDHFMSATQNLMSGPGAAPHTQWVHLYLNGLYWGVYHMHERPDDSFATEYHGGNREDWDILKHNSNDVVSGNDDAYDELLTKVRRSMTDSGNYRAVADMLDLSDFADYMILNFYAGNSDWAHKNWYASYNRVDPNGKWRFHSWDAEKVFESLGDDFTDDNDTGGPTEIHTRLRANPEYRLLFADRVHKHMFNNGVLTPAGAAATVERIMGDIDRAIVGESARWGDNRIDTTGSRYNRDNWLSTMNGLLDNYFPQRTGRVLSQLRSDSLYPSTAAPTFSRYGGTVASGFDLTISKPSGTSGTIYYTTDGSDPRASGGGRSSSAIQYNGSIDITRATTVRARIQNGSSWSALTEALFATDTANLRVSEIMYHPADPPAGSPYNATDFEFIELKNVGTQTLRLKDVVLSEGVDFTFPNVDLAAGAYGLLVENRSAFESRYGTGLPILGQFTGELDNGGEPLRLADAAGTTILAFTYDDTWHPTTDGGGPSLVKIDPAGASGGFGTGSNWRPSNRPGGSPGAAEPAPDTTPPTADIENVSPDPRADGVPSVTITFSEPVTNFDRADLRLTRDGGSTNLLTADQPLTTADGGATWTLGNLAGITAAPGAYTLTLLAGAGGPTDLANNPLAANVTDTWQVTPPPPTAPTVTGVYVRGTAWTGGYLESLKGDGLGSDVFGYAVPSGALQHDELPWGNLNQVSVRFSGAVSVQQGDLAVTNSQGTTIPFAATDAFTYDAATSTATWTLGRALANEKVTLRLNGDAGSGVTATAGGALLDGDWTNPAGTPPAGGRAFPSGNGTAGGDFVFSLRTLPGDFDRNGAVNLTDFGVIRSHFGGFGKTVLQGDTNGDGTVNLADFGTVRANFGKTTPA